MIIGFGRRRVLIEMCSEHRDILDRFPALVGASDDELARMASQRDAVVDRDRWSTESAFLYGISRTR